MDRIFPMIRAAGLERLAAFLRDVRAEYAESRNFDLGLQGRSTTSTLSPYSRHRCQLDDIRADDPTECSFIERGAQPFRQWAVRAGTRCEVEGINRDRSAVGEPPPDKVSPPPVRPTSGAGSISMPYWTSRAHVALSGMSPPFR